MCVCNVWTFNQRGMLNQQMFDDKKDAEIARLKMAIEKFKAYDEERKRYYAESMQRLGALEEFVREVTESRAGRGDLESTVIRLKKQLADANRVILARGIEERRTPEEIKEVIDTDTIKKRNKDLKRTNKMLLKARDELFLKVLRLEKEVAALRLRLAEAVIGGRGEEPVPGAR